MIDYAENLIALVGIPYVEGGRDMRGADCWGVVLLAARRLWGLELPEYFYSPADVLAQARDLIERETAGPRWREVPLPVGPGAVHVFRIKGHETHCGVHLGGSSFLHSLPGRNSCVEDLNDSNWRQRRTGTYVYR